MMPGIIRAITAVCKNTNNELVKSKKQYTAKYKLVNWKCLCNERVTYITRLKVSVMTGHIIKS